MPNMADLREVKKALEIDPGDLSEDAKLLLFIEQMTEWVTEYLNRDIWYKTRTQYYIGTGTQKLLLRCRPVFPSPPAPYTALTVSIDEAGLFGTAAGAFTTDGTVQSLTYGVDYTLQIDQDDGSSRSAILWLVNDYWPRPIVRQAGLLSSFMGTDMGSVKVVYTAGWTLDTMPAAFRFACNDIVAKMRFVMPLGMEIGSTSYEEISYGFITEKKNYIMSMAMPILMQHRNWKW